MRATIVRGPLVRSLLLPLLCSLLFPLVIVIVVVDPAAADRRNGGARKPNDAANVAANVADGVDAERADAERADAERADAERADGDGGDADGAGLGRREAVDRALDLGADADPRALGLTSPALGVAALGVSALRRAPAVADVLEAAYTTAGLDRDPTRGWIRRARIAGLVPWLTVRTGWDASWRDEEPGEVGRSRTFEVRATWRLDRLLFDGREIQISTVDASRRRERRRLASYVVRAYFTWKKVTALAARNPSGRYALAAEAATAELDALTDGWFSESFVQRTAPSPP